MFVACMGDEVDDTSVVPHDEANGQWELQSLMKRYVWGTWDVWCPCGKRSTMNMGPTF